MHVPIHIYESSEITGKWFEKIQKTYSFSVSWNGNEFSLIRFNLMNHGK